MTDPVTEPATTLARPPGQPKLYAIVDVSATRDPMALARRALEAQCAFLQLRAKRLDDHTFLEVARELRALCKQAQTAFVINDRADIARLVAADGVHLGQEDMSVADARRVAADLLIGVSTHDPEQAAQAQHDGADLIAFGPVFPTQTKDRPDPVVGLQMLGHVCRNASRPVVAIGGITPSNVAATLEAGATYFAVISALPQFLEAR